MKYRILFFALIIVSILTINIHANDDFLPSDNKDSITITFENEEYLTEEQKNRLTDIVLKYKTSGIIDNNLSTYSLLCTLFGHNTEENVVTATEHKVRSSEPRCDMTTYRVETCSRCDYENISVISETYVYCCPED